jgi:copper(I)-binding protein
MKSILNPLCAFALCAAAVPALAAPPSTTSVSDCWVRAMPGDLPSGGYFKLTNAGNEPVDLVGVKSDAFGSAMMHETQSQGSTSTMAMVDKVSVPAHGFVAFAPGGYHVMLEQPKAPLKVGSRIVLTFALSDGHAISSECSVKSPATMGQ